MGQFTSPSGEHKPANAEVSKSFRHLRKSYRTADRPAESSLGGSVIRTVSNRSFTELDSQPIWRTHACVSSRCCAALPSHTQETLLGKDVSVSITARERQAHHQLT